MARGPTGRFRDAATIAKGLVETLLSELGEPGKCKVCHCRVFWVRNRGGAVVAYSVEGRHWEASFTKDDTKIY